MDNKSITFDEAAKSAIPKEVRNRMDEDRKRARTEQMEDGFDAIMLALPKGVVAVFRPKKDSDVSFFEFKSKEYIEDKPYDALINAVKFYFDFLEVFHESDRTDFRVFIRDEDHHAFKMYAAHGVVSNGLLHKPKGCLMESNHRLNGCGKCGSGNWKECGFH